MQINKHEVLCFVHTQRDGIFVGCSVVEHKTPVQPRQGTECLLSQPRSSGVQKMGLELLVLEELRTERLQKQVNTLLR